jgi:cis-L-3-hydroxyproline dehydratase
MNLTDYEKSMLQGCEGALKQKAMEVIVRYAKVLEAEELCQVTKAHLHCGAHHYLKAIKTGTIDSIISEMYFCSSQTIPLENVVCDCVSDVGPMCPFDWEQMGVTKEEYERDQEYLSHYVAAGVKLYGSCVPYLLGFIPLMGEHYVTSESHVVLMVNSIWGACGNSDGIEAGFCSAICGRTPLWGNHIMSNRKGTHVFDIQCRTKTVFDWDVLGFTIGRKLPTHTTPILSGNFSRPDIYKLKACYASMATRSGPEMCHIIGITPEAVTMEQALGGKKPQDTLSITPKDLAETLSIFHEEGEVDYIGLGCPHYSLEEIRQAAVFLEGKQISSHVMLHIWTSYAFKAMADRCGYTSTIERAGGRILTSSCPTTHDRLPPGITSLAFDSSKQAQDYLFSSSRPVFFGSMTDCLKSAISGRWEGRRDDQ